MAAAIPPPDVGSDAWSMRSTAWRRIWSAAKVFDMDYLRLALSGVEDEKDRMSPLVSAELVMNREGRGAITRERVGQVYDGERDTLGRPLDFVRVVRERPPAMV